MKRLSFAVAFCAWLFVAHNFISPESHAVMLWITGAFVMCLVYIDESNNTK